jgi:hypothetical protein
MKKNRKTAEAYRLNGHPSFHPGSIRSVQIAELEARVEEFEGKLADRYDPDDRRWTARWLSRFRKNWGRSATGASSSRASGATAGGAAQRLNE